MSRIIMSVWMHNILTQKERKTVCVCVCVCWRKEMSEKSNIRWDTVKRDYHNLWILWEEIRIGVVAFFCNQIKIENGLMKLAKKRLHSYIWYYCIYSTNSKSDKNRRLKGIRTRKTYTKNVCFSLSSFFLMKQLKSEKKL